MNTQLSFDHHSSSTQASPTKIRNRAITQSDIKAKTVLLNRNELNDQNYCDMQNDQSQTKENIRGNNKKNTIHYYYKMYTEKYLEELKQQQNISQNSSEIFSTSLNTSQNVINKEEVYSQNENPDQNFIIPQRSEQRKQSTKQFYQSQVLGLISKFATQNKGPSQFKTQINHKKKPSISEEISYSFENEQEQAINGNNNQINVIFQERNNDEFYFKQLYQESLKCKQFQRNLKLYEKQNYLLGIKKQQENHEKQLIEQYPILFNNNNESKQIINQISNSNLNSQQQIQETINENSFEQINTQDIKMDSIQHQGQSITQNESSKLVIQQVSSQETVLNLMFLQSEQMWLQEYQQSIKIKKLQDNQLLIQQYQLKQSITPYIILEQQQQQMQVCKELNKIKDLNNNQQFLDTINQSQQQKQQQQKTIKNTQTTLQNNEQIKQIVVYQQQQTENNLDIQNQMQWVQQLVLIEQRTKLIKNYQILEQNISLNQLLYSEQDQYNSVNNKKKSNIKEQQIQEKKELELTSSQIMWNQEQQYCQKKIKLNKDLQILDKINNSYQVEDNFEINNVQTLHITQFSQNEQQQQQQQQQQQPLQQQQILKLSTTLDQQNNSIIEQQQQEVNFELQNNQFEEQILTSQSTQQQQQLLLTCSSNQHDADIELSDILLDQDKNNKQQQAILQPKISALKGTRRNQSQTKQIQERSVQFPFLDEKIEEEKINNIILGQNEGIKLDLSKLNAINKQHNRKKKSETQSANSKRSIRSNWSNKTFKEKAEEVAAPAVGTALVGSLGVVLAKNVLKGKQQLLGIIPALACGAYFYYKASIKDNLDDTGYEEDDDYEDSEDENKSQNH